MTSLLERVADRFEQRTDPVPSGVRAAALARFDTPAKLARHIRPDTVQTPMLDAIDAAIMLADSGEHRFWIINTPPQEGKSTRLQAAGAWLLSQDPSRRIAYASYEQGLAQVSGLVVRQVVETHGSGYAGGRLDPDRDDVLGLAIDPSRGAAGAWRLARTDDVPVPGGVISVGVGSGFTGRPADVLIVDDPIKGAAEADSPKIRRNLKDWWESVASTRLAPDAIVIVVQCMTGDTPVLRPDGTETPLRDIRAGDRIATYERGALAVSTVRNWANQGPDNVYAIKMKSGVVVRANARHPFLVVDGEGRETWQRVADLKPGAYILRAGAEGGSVSRALPTTAPKLSVVRGFASPTTTAHAGPPDMVAEVPSRTAVRTSVTATASTRKTTTASLPSREACAPSADATRTTRERQPTGAASCASTTVTTRQRCAGSSATIATSWSDAGAPRSASALELNTWNVTPDRVVEIVPAGVEDVFDIQVDRTENFIANGLVSHNTRWHEDDLAGWLISEDDPKNPKWRVLSISAQALAEDPNAKPPIGPDPLGRTPGQWMVSARGRTVADWEEKRRAVGRGGRWWNALYQQRPAPPEGGMFRRDWFNRDRIHELPAMRRVIVQVDPADNTGDGDEAGIIVAGTTAEGRHVLIADYSGHFTVDGWFRRAYFALIEHEAQALQWEKSLSGLRRQATRTWKALRFEARTLVEAWREQSTDPFPSDQDPYQAVLHRAEDALSKEEDTKEDRTATRTKLMRLWPYVVRLRAMPTTGPYVKVINPVGSKEYRAMLCAPLFENREVSILSFLSSLEHEMATWQEGQKSPNRMDGAVHALLELSRSDGGTTINPATGGNLPRHQAAAPRLIPRSTDVMIRR